jgi:hypothetical protein
VKKQGVLQRLTPLWAESLHSFEVTRYHGVITVDGKNWVFVGKGTQVADLALAKPGDTLEIGVSQFNGPEIWLRSARLILPEDSDGFRDVFKALRVPVTTGATILRKGSYFRREYDKVKEVVRLALFMEIAGVKGIVSVSTEDVHHLIAGQEGDQFAVSLTEHGGLKGATLTKLWRHPKDDY